MTYAPAAARLTEPADANYILGTDGDDLFTLTNDPHDVVCGFGGDDGILGVGGGQDLQAGDIFLGGPGNDTMYTVFGGTFNGEAGCDVVDVFYGSGGTFNPGDQSTC